jgi:hypothetical protein
MLHRDMLFRFIKNIYLIFFKLFNKKIIFNFIELKSREDFDFYSYSGLNPRSK